MIENYYAYTRFLTRNAVRNGKEGSATLVEIHPPHYIAKRKDSVPCVGDYTLADNARRANDAVRTKTMLTLDVDTEVQSMEEFRSAGLQLEGASKLLESAGVEHLYYSSYSHGRPKDGELPYFGFRLVVPFLEPMSIDNTPNLSIDFKRCAKAITEQFKLPGNIMALSQPWYIPSVPDAASLATAVYIYKPGAALDWRKFDFRRGAPKPIVKIEETDAPYKAASVAEVRRRLQEQAQRSPAVAAALRLVLAPRAPTVGEVRSRHDDLLIPVTLAIARTAEPGEQVDELLLAIEPWLEVMQETYPRAGAGWLGEGKRALEGALLKVPQWRAEREAEMDAFIQQFEVRRKRFT